MRISLAQAENGVPTPTIDGDYVFDPMADAERIIAMMKRVTPVMYPDDEVVSLSRIQGVAKHFMLMTLPDRKPFKHLDAESQNPSHCYQFCIPLQKAKP